MICCKSHDLICNNLKIFAHIGIFELHRISLAKSVIVKEPSSFIEINFLSFKDAKVSRIFPTPCRFSSEFSKCVSLNVPFSLIANCNTSKSIVPNFLINLHSLNNIC